MSTISHSAVLESYAHWQRDDSRPVGWRLSMSDRILNNARLEDNDTTSYLLLQLDPAKFDDTEPVRIELRTKAPKVDIKVYDAKRNPISVNVEKGGATVEVSAGEKEFQPFQGFSMEVPANSSLSRIELRTPIATPLERVDIYHAPAGSSDYVNMTPEIAQPKFKPAIISPQVTQTKEGFTLKSTSLSAEFSTQNGLRLLSLRNQYAGKNILINPQNTHLFLTEVDDKRFGAEQWKVEKVLLLKEDTIQVELSELKYHLNANFTVGIENDGLKLDLKIRNTGTSEQRWKTVFPQIGGMAVSKQADDDYYLYPMYGGLVQNVNANLRMYYGAGNSSLWQMMDLYSPELGTGVSMRSLDKNGTLKGMAFRKGETNPAYATMLYNGLKGRVAPDYLWKQSLSSSKGASMGFEYSAYTRSGGEEVVYPSAIIEMHQGDWHQAMQTYADWAHKAWKWRPLHSKLDDVWKMSNLNQRVSNRYTKKLYVDGKWNDDFSADFDMYEWVRWWKWADKGPFDLPLEKEAMIKEGGERVYKTLSSWMGTDPITGEDRLLLTFGDTEYGESKGGLSGFRAAVQKSQERGWPVQLYTAPMLTTSNSNMGKYGPKYGVINPYYPTLAPGDLPAAPRDGHVIQYDAYRLDINNAQLIDVIANDYARIVKDIGVDAIRMDEVGFGGFACYSTEHSHLYGRTGEHWAMRAMTKLAERVHEEASKVKPDFLLTTEYPGADILAAQLDGSLMSESSKYTFAGLRTLPVNIFRFYFPEVKAYEYMPNERGSKVAFWNASGTYLQGYPEEYHRVLKENGDAFRSREVMPLVPTLKERIYANRFDAPNKQITLLFNDSDEIVDAPVLKAKQGSDKHYFDLLNGKELPVKNGSIQVKIATDDAAAVAHLPKVLSLQGNTVTLSDTLEEASIVICDAKGKELSHQKVSGQKVLLSRENVEDAKYIKLFGGKYLVDAIELN